MCYFIELPKVEGNWFLIEATTELLDGEYHPKRFRSVTLMQGKMAAIITSMHILAYQQDLSEADRIKHIYHSEDKTNHFRLLRHTHSLLSCIVIA